MVFEPITPAHREAVERIRRTWGAGTCSSHAFQSLYLWQNVMQLTIHPEDDFFAVRIRRNGENCWFMPCGNPEKILRFLDSLRQKGGFRLFYVQTDEMRFLKENLPFPLTFRQDRDAWEYLYDTAEQCRAEGRRFSQIRYVINRLKRLYHTEIRPLTPETADDAEAVIRAWSARKEISFDLHEGDVTEACTVIRQQEMLSSAGVIVYLDGIPSAVSAGFPISSDTFDLCLYKQSIRERGLGYLSFHALNQQAADSFRFVNLEEDLGIPGIRDHKLRLRPAGFTEMWEAIYEPSE